MTSNGQVSTAAVQPATPPATKVGTVLHCGGIMAHLSSGHTKIAGGDTADGATLQMQHRVHMLQDGQEMGVVGQERRRGWWLMHGSRVNSCGQKQMKSVLSLLLHAKPNLMVHEHSPFRRTSQPSPPSLHHHTHSFLRGSIAESWLSMPLFQGSTGKQPTVVAFAPPLS